MCHRLLQFHKSTTCGHLTFVGDNTIDCHMENCHLSSSHPSSCGTQTPCHCRRYYSSSSQPQRIVTQELPGKCAQCPP
ncbi:hypothetical protein BV22DRAFT_33307 [Leucogyrophana mollusca]|uniref:Uncharacterized protein n=1 Tax=Leucogyrophana mollusca TaxID=85980 RepID=A0ACB8BZB2_9AGAM|nr:hypothetical protein BV22DRAFT_33307 [Leucogyrophana mollusca]